MLIPDLKYFFMYLKLILDFKNESLCYRYSNMLRVLPMKLYVWMTCMYVCMLEVFHNKS